MAANPCLEPLPQTAAATPCLQPPSRTAAPKLYRLYLSPEPETLTHARALLALLEEYCDDAIGAYVPCADLETFYRYDVCGLNNWEPRHWTAVARHLGKITTKRTLRRNGQRFVCYQVPRP